MQRIKRQNIIAAGFCAKCRKKNDRLPRPLCSECAAEYAAKMKKHWPARICICGCGQTFMPKDGRHKIIIECRKNYDRNWRRHNWRRYKQAARKKNPPPQFERTCACGCDKTFFTHDRRRRFIAGHARRKVFPAVIERVCICGCGKAFVAKDGRIKYIDGHNVRYIARRKPLSPYPKKNTDGLCPSCQVRKPAGDEKYCEPCRIGMWGSVWSNAQNNV